MNTDKPNSKEQNEYAKNVKGDPVFILNAESGRKGYWCMGCDAEMEAVRRKKNILHKSYFRHVAKDVKKGEIPCTFSNQEFRHNLAIDILQRTKRIKVPNLYKYSPDGKSAKLIQEAKFIEAHSVKAELSFYEDDDGNVLFGKNPEIDNKNLLIIPDVTFFDVQGKPILLIEIVVTHKLNDDKKAKIRRLGIDTIQIIIPKDSPENIAKNFLGTKNTKWVFNHVEQNTNYLQLPSGHTEGISQIDELQMGLLRESIICRRNQISNLIRSITRCVESQLYKRVEFNIGQEIQRIEKATREHQSRLDEIQEGIENEIYSELGNRREELDTRKEEFREYCSGLEKRYFAKRNELEQEQEYTNGDIKFRYEVGRTEEDIRKEFDRKESEIRDGYNFEEGVISIDEERIRNEIIGIYRDEERIRADIDKRRRYEQSRYSENYKSITSRINSLRNEFERKERFIIEQLEEEERKLVARIRKEEESIETEIQNYRRRIIQHMEGDDNFRIEELPDRIKKLSYTRRILNDWEEEHSTYQRYRLALEYVKKGTWKKWN